MENIRIKRPVKSGTMIFHCKLFYSIILQAVADAKFRIADSYVSIDVGAYGKQSNGACMLLVH